MKWLRIHASGWNFSEKKKFIPPFVCKYHKPFSDDFQKRFPHASFNFSTRRIIFKEPFQTAACALWFFQEINLCP